MIVLCTVLLGVVLTFGLISGGVGMITMGTETREERRLLVPALVLVVSVSIWAVWLFIARYNGWIAGY